MNENRLRSRAERQEYYAKLIEELGFEDEEEDVVIPERFVNTDEHAQDMEALQSNEEQFAIFTEIMDAIAKQEAGEKTLKL
jgi:hypothetical protein